MSQENAQELTNMIMTYINRNEMMIGEILQVLKFVEDNIMSMTIGQSPVLNKDRDLEKDDIKRKIEQAKQDALSKIDKKPNKKPKKDKKKP